jgi:hypothetical protein
MIRLERTRQEPHGLGEIKALTSKIYVFLALEPFGQWPTGRNRLVCMCVYRQSEAVSQGRAASSLCHPLPLNLYF